jgi:hypothetical protein
MNFSEFVQGEESRIILQSVVDYPNVHIEEDPRYHGEEATWEYINSDLEVRIIIYKDYLDGSYKNLTPPEFQKNFFHPDLGVIPHELLEGNLTGIVMKKQFDLIPLRYRSSFNRFKDQFDKLFLSYKFSENNIHEHMNAYDAFGGVVHDLIVDSTPGYSAWENYAYRKIFG